MIRILLLVLLLPQLLFSADIYTDCSVAGPGAGTSGDPYSSLQAAIDTGASGDVFFIANIDPCVLTGTLTFNTGFSWTNQTDLWTTFKAWDNGGSLTFTTPSGSVIDAAEIDGDGVSTYIFDYSTMSSNFRFLGQGLVMSGATSNIWRGRARCMFYQSKLDGGSTSIRMGSGEAFVDSEMSSSNSSYTVSTLATSKIDTCLVKNTGSGKGVRMDGDASVVINSVIDVSGGTGHGIETITSQGHISGNTIKGNSTAGQWGVYNTEEMGVVINNVIQDFDGTGSGGIYGGTGTGDVLVLIDGNDFYNNTSNVDNTNIIYEGSLGQTESSDPLDTDYTLVSGTNAEDNGISIGGLKDIGAAESTESGGGGSATISCPFVQ